MDAEGAPALTREMMDAWAKTVTEDYADEPPDDSGTTDDPAAAEDTPPSVE